MAWLDSVSIGWYLVVGTGAYVVLCLAPWVPVVAIVNRMRRRR